MRKFCAVSLACVMAVMLGGCEEWTYSFHAGACLMADYLLNGNNKSLILSMKDKDRDDAKYSYLIKKIETGEKPTVAIATRLKRDEVPTVNATEEEKAADEKKYAEKAEFVSLSLTKAQHLRICFIMTEIQRDTDSEDKPDNPDVLLMLKIEKEIRERMYDPAHARLPENKVKGLELETLKEKEGENRSGEGEDDKPAIKNEQTLLLAILLLGYVNDGANEDLILPVFRQCRSNAGHLEFLQDASGTRFSIYLRNKDGKVLETMPLRLSKIQLQRMIRLACSKKLAKADIVRMICPEMKE